MIWDKLLPYFFKEVGLTAVTIDKSFMKLFINGRLT